MNTDRNSHAACHVCGTVHDAPFAISPDARGPIRTIVAVGCEDKPGLIELSCGHFPDLNPIYTYRVGDNCRCFKCKLGCPVPGARAMAKKTPWDFGHEDGLAGRTTRLVRDPRTPAEYAYHAGQCYGICEAYVARGETPPGGLPVTWRERYARDIDHDTRISRLAAETAYITGPLPSDDPAPMFGMFASSDAFRVESIDMPDPNGKYGRRGVRRDRSGLAMWGWQVGDHHLIVDMRPAS